MTYRYLAISVLAGLTLSPGAIEACICVGGVPAAQRQAVFVGTAVEMVGTQSIPGVGTRRDVRFVVRASWRGPERDTVTVSSLIAGDCGANFLPGSTYLVIGDYDGHLATTGECDRGIGAPAAANLPRPTWVAAAEGRRSFDASVVPVGQPVPPGDPILVLLSVPRRKIAMAEDLSRYRLEVADNSVETDRRGQIWLRVPTGRYRLRVTPPSEESFEIDLWVSCDTPNGCYANRSIPRSARELPEL